jgi:hypothetical protein
MHGTGTALSGIATHVGSGEMQLITDQLDQKGPGINVDLNGTPIHGERKRFGGMAQSCLLKAADFLGVHLNPISILGQRGTKHARAFSSAIGFSLMLTTNKRNEEVVDLPLKPVTKPSCDRHRHVINRPQPSDPQRKF